MLDQHTDLIERLVHGSLTRQREFNQGWSFTNDGTLYFTVWDEDGTTFFSWSEREPSTSADLQTDCDSVAAYVLTTQLGAKRAMALHFEVPRFPERLEQLHPSWAADKTAWPPTLSTIRASAFIQIAHPIPCPSLMRCKTISKTS